MRSQIAGFVRVSASIFTHRASHCLPVADCLSGPACRTDCLDKPKFGGANKRKQACVIKFKQLKQIKHLEALHLPPLYRVLGVPSVQNAASSELVPFSYVDGSGRCISMNVSYEELLGTSPTAQLIDYNADVLEASHTTYEGRSLANCVMHIHAVPELSAAAASVVQLLTARCVSDECVLWRSKAIKESRLWPYLGNQLRLRSPSSRWSRGFENYALTSGKVRTRRSDHVSFVRTHPSIRVACWHPISPALACLTKQKRCSPTTWLRAQASNSAQRNHTLLLGADFFLHELLPLADHLCSAASTLTKPDPEPEQFGLSIGAGFVLGLERLYRAACDKVGSAFKLEECHLLDQAELYVRSSHESGEVVWTA